VRGWARPARPVAPIAVAFIIVGVWWLVAHDGGAGWVQLLGDVVFGTLLIGIVGPSVVVSRARVVVRSAPADGVAGLALEVGIEAGTRLRVRAVVPRGPEAFVGPVGRGRRAGDRITLVPLRRGVHECVTLDIASAAPFALQWWTRRVRIPLPHALHVSPRLGRVAPARPSPREEEAGVVVERPRADSGLPRGARPYGPGDGRRLVHWRATAHAGTLMVKELERPSADPAVVTVDLPEDPDEAERVAERALGTVVDLLRGGSTVMLDTHEPSGRVVALVADRRVAGRRLARAVARGAGAVARGARAVAPDTAAR
jgi:uncharacterized protein (DUF58 family)